MSEPTRRTIWKWRTGAPLTPAEDDLAAEEPLEIRVNRRAVSVTLRTPGHDEELAAGFLFTEGLIPRREAIAEIVCHEGSVDVRLAPEQTVDWARLARNVFATSSCGICGRASIEALESQFPPLAAPDAAATTPRIPPGTVAAMPTALLTAQSSFAKTGGLHAAGLFSQTGELLCAREDIGRHNAVDKVIGRAVLDAGLPLGDRVLLVSGRASFEIVQKTLAARIPMLAAVSAPSSLAVAAAEEAGITLIGFLRDGRMNIYTHPARVMANRVAET